MGGNTVTQLSELALVVTQPLREAEQVAEVMKLYVRICQWLIELEVLGSTSNVRQHTCPLTCFSDAPLSKEFKLE